MLIYYRLFPSNEDSYDGFVQLIVVQGPVNVVHDASTWLCEHEWRQDLAVVTKWLSGMSPVCYILLRKTNSTTSLLAFTKSLF